MDNKIAVPGTTMVINVGSIYQVQPKYDSSAPEGFQKERTTKVINPLATNTVPIPFDVTSNVWDTGFYRTSPCLRGMTETEKEVFVEKINELLVKPIEELRGEGFFKHTADNKTLDEYGIRLGITTSFNTADPKQLADLYFVVLGHHLAPKEDESNPIYREAQFVVTDSEEEYSRKQEAEFERNAAVGEFFGLMKQDKESLINILDYMGISVSKEINDKTLNTVFTHYLEDKSYANKNGKHFLDTVKRFRSKKGKEELYVYQILKKLAQKGRVKIVSGDYYLDDEYIGTSLKHAAESVNSNSELKKKAVIMSED